MILEDILGKSIDDMSVEELEEEYRRMRRLKVSDTKKKSKSPSKSNKQKSIESLLKSLPEETLGKIQEELLNE